MRTVLIIDDDPGILTPVKSILEHAGYATISASSPIDGLEKARALRREIDLIVTDVTMPGLDGLTLIQQVFDDLGVMRVLLMSGNAKVSSRLPVLRKPFLMQELLNRVATVLEAPLPSPTDVVVPEPPHATVTEQLRTTLDEARRQFVRYSQEFSDVAKDVPSGLPSPDGIDRIGIAAKKRQLAFQQYQEALRHFDDHSAKDDIETA